MSEMDSVFSECLIWAVGLFVIGIMFREFSPDDLGKWIGRSAVAASVFLLSAFSFYSQHQCQVIYSVTSSANAKGISDDYNRNHVVLTTSKGNVIEGDSNGLRSRGRRSSGSSGRVLGYEGIERSGTTIHGVPRNGGNGYNVWSLVYAAVVPDESRSADESSNASAASRSKGSSIWPRAVFEIDSRRQETVFGVVEKKPVKTPALSDIR